MMQILHGMDALVICGGDGSLTGADIFRSEWPGLLDELVKTGTLTAEQIAPHKHLNIVGMVGSIDNDMSSTDATIGCYSALDRICSNINLIETTADSHQRAFVVEVMGRHCGWLANMAGNSCGADYIFIPEAPPKPGEWQKVLGDIVRSNRSKGKRTTMVIVSEGAILTTGEKLTCSEIKDFLANDLKLDARITNLGHIQRGGDPVYYDRALGTLQGCEAIKAVLSATPETPSPFIAIVENEIIARPLMDAVRLTQEVPKAIHNQDFAKVRSLRDPEFNEYLETFGILNSVDQPELLLPENEVFPPYMLRTELTVSSV
jgi:6-phosphofructokinase 1